MTLRSLVTHDDERGQLTELFRETWAASGEAPPSQWNWLRSRKGTLRGVQVHPRRRDYLVLVAGRAIVGLRDLRPGVESHGMVACVELRAEEPSALSIPFGVAHGFLYLEDSLQLLGLTPTWQQEEDLRCRWDDPALGIPWPERPTRLSAIDAAAGSFTNLESAFKAGFAEPHGPKVARPAAAASATSPAATPVE